MLERLVGALAGHDDDLFKRSVELAHRAHVGRVGSHGQRGSAASLYFFFGVVRLGTLTVSVTVVAGLRFASSGLTNRPVFAERVTFLVFAMM